MTRLTLAVGLPASGKSTWFRRHGIKPVSTDAIRELLTGDPYDQSAQDEVTGVLVDVIGHRLYRHMDTYIDATNTVASARRLFIDIAKLHRVPIHALVFVASLETCLARNEKRTAGRVPPATMAAMDKQFKSPELSEGFDQILVAHGGGCTILAKANQAEQNVA